MVVSEMSVGDRSPSRLHRKDSNWGFVNSESDVIKKRNQKQPTKPAGGILIHYGTTMITLK